MDPTILASIVGAGQNTMSHILGMVDGAINRSFQRKEAQKNRDFQSAESALQRDWSSQEAERARDWNEEMYAKYNSLSGKVAQAEQAGINPLFAVTGSATTPMSTNASAPSGASAGSVGTSSGASASFAGIVNLMDGILKAKMTKQDMATSKALEDKYIAEADNIRQNTSWIDRLNEIKISEIESNIEVNTARVSESLQNVQESISRVSVNDSVVRVNNADVSLKGSQTELNITKQVVERLNAEQIKLCLPYIQARQEAAIYLDNASADNQVAQSFKNTFEAEKAIYDANISMLNVLKEQKLIDSSYYDDLIEKAHFEAANEKRDYKWKPINDICSNLSKLMIGVGAVTQSGGSFKKDIAAGVIKEVASLTMF